MKKLIIILLIGCGLVYFYFWYVRGINLLLQEPDSLQLQPYTSFATRLPPKAGQKPSTAAYWQSAAAMPTPRVDAAAAADNGKIYMIGGLDGLARTMDSVEVFDISKDTWSTAPPLPKALHHAAAITVDGKIYVIGGLKGLSATPSDTLYIFDPKMNAWTTGKPLPSPVGSASVVYDGKLIRVLGGTSDTGTSDTQYTYDIGTGQWTAAETLLGPREQATAGYIDGRIFLVGGRQGSLAYDTGTLDVFSIADRLWERWDSMPTARSDIGGAVVGGKLYVFGGQAPTVTFGDVEMLDPTTRKWKSVGTMPTPRHGAGVVAVDGRIFVIGGGLHPGLSVSDVNEVFVPAK